ncbi:MAG: hypothetical protein FJ320_02815 [SAR202 cluster bacterium]|nr:hypothetical protein [SAR202 cluster bacterium]
MPVDTNKILLTGENPYIRLSPKKDGEFTTRSSYWRILFSPGGPGHVLFITSELTGNKTKVYSDNINMTRWLQGEIEKYLHAPFGDQNVPVVDAEFDKSGDLRSYWTESIYSSEGEIHMTWYDLGEPFISHTPVGQRPTSPHGVYTVLIPARGARLTINGEQASGKPYELKRESAIGSTASLAFSESWLGPRK